MFVNVISNTEKQFDDEKTFDLSCFCMLDDENNWRKSEMY